MKIKSLSEFTDTNEPIVEDMGGVSAPMSTVVNTPGVGNAAPAQTAAMTGAQQTSQSAIGSGDKWGDGPMYDQNGKVKKKKRVKAKKKNAKKAKKINKKVNENNLNPYDKIGAMMAKKMGVPQPFKKKDSKTNTIEQNFVDKGFSKKNGKYKLFTLDDYANVVKHVKGSNKVKKAKVNEEETPRDVNATKDTKAKDELMKLGVAVEYRKAKSGKMRTFIKTPMKQVLEILEKNGWKEAGRNAENTIRKYTKDDNVLAIYADGKDYPRATLTKLEQNNESLLPKVVVKRVVPTSVEPYVKRLAR